MLAWRLSNTMDTSFCVSALEEALARFGRPEIFNTDQGSQFTSAAFTGALAATGVRISMDGRGRWMDNVFIERLWRSLKYEDIYLEGYSDGHEAEAGIARWIASFTISSAPIRRWKTARRWRSGGQVSPAHSAKRLWIGRFSQARSLDNAARCPHPHSQDSSKQQ
ncbi:hypothetical protein ABIA00_000153 [Bradyrhizobium ottawaense]